MPGLRSKMLEYGPAMTLTLVLAGAAIAALWMRSDFTWIMPSRAYPIRIELQDPSEPKPTDRITPARLASAEAALSQQPKIAPTDASAALAPAATPANQLSGAPASTVAPLPAAAPPVKKVNGIMQIQFDLTDPHDNDKVKLGGSTVDIRKPVRLNGADVGTALIHVTSDSRLLIARDEVRQIVAKAGLANLATQIGSGGLMSFDDLRDKGVVVRYDPVSDRILVST